MGAENGGRVFFRIPMTEALKMFREASVVVLKGPTQAEFSEVAGMATSSSAQAYFAKLEEVGWIKPVNPANRKVGYVLTPSGERRYREVVPEEDRKGAEWPVD